MFLRILFAACMLCASLAGAQTYPVKPVRIICPFPAGGLSDNFLRALAQGLTKHWGQQVLVENRPGANTMIAADVTAGVAASATTAPARASTPRRWVNG